jgi:hypothetical protein
MRRMVFAAFTLALVGAPQAHVLAGSDDPEVQDEVPGVSRLYVIERTTTGPSTLSFGAGFGYGFGQAEDGLIALTAVRDDPGAASGIDSTAFGFMLSAGGGTLPEAYVLGERYDCSSISDPPPEECELVISGGGTGLGYLYEDEGGPDDPDRMFVAVHGSGPGASLGGQTKGWTIREVPPTFHFVRGYESQAVGVQGLFAGGEVFLSASTSGPEHGSVAVGQPPCGFPMFEPGAGANLLRGGAADRIHVCGADWGGVADFATGTTTWRLEGAAAGASHWFGPARLLVIDLPPPCTEEEEEQGCEDLRPR